MAGRAQDSRSAERHARPTEAAAAGVAAVDAKLARMVAEVLLGSPVARALGFELERLEPGRAVIALPFAARNVTVGDIVHGGVIATLIDVAGVAAALSGAAAEGFGGCATSALSISYLAPAKGSALRAEASTLRRSRRQAVADVAVFAGPVLVAKALATISLF
jgi:uncharacterized protein (TIGR00369 family)